MKRTMNEVHDEKCAVAATAEIVAAKWTPLIVHDLSEGPRRFKELERACPGISPRTLSERLDIIFQNVQPRTAELRAQNLIEDSGERRPTKYGNASIVWRAIRGGP